MAATHAIADRRAMSVLPPFFLLAGLMGAFIWLVPAPYPFPILGKLIVGASVAGFALSITYVRAFLPEQWQAKLAAVRRVWQSIIGLLHAR